MNCPHCGGSHDPAYECAMQPDEHAFEIAWTLAHCTHASAILKRPAGTIASCADWCGVCGAHREPDGTWLRHQAGADAFELDERMYPAGALADHAARDSHKKKH